MCNRAKKKTCNGTILWTDAVSPDVTLYRLQTELKVTTEEKEIFLSLNHLINVINVVIILYIKTDSEVNLLLMTFHFYVTRFLVYHFDQVQSQLKVLVSDDNILFPDETETKQSQIICGLLIKFQKHNIIYRSHFFCRLCKLILLMFHCICYNANLIM